MAQRVPLVCSPTSSAFGTVLGCRDLDTDTAYIVRHFSGTGPTVMPRMKGRSGRNRREISWTPTAFAGVHLRSYRLWWQLGVPFWVGPDKQLVEPSRPGVPVPATVERRENHCQPDPTGIRDKPTPRAMTGTRHCKCCGFPRSLDARSASMKRGSVGLQEQMFGAK